VAASSEARGWLFTNPGGTIPKTFGLEAATRSIPYAGDAPATHPHSARAYMRTQDTPRIPAVLAKHVLGMIDRGLIEKKER